MVSSFVNGRYYKWTGPGSYTHKFWNSTKNAWLDGRVRACIATHAGPAGEVRASFSGITGTKKAGQAGWNYAFCLDHFTEVNKDGTPVLGKYDHVAPANVALDEKAILDKIFS